MTGVQTCALPIFLRHSIEDVREALQVSPSVPIITCDARNRDSTKSALIAVVEHTMSRATARA